MGSTVWFRRQVPDVTGYSVLLARRQHALIFSVAVFVQGYIGPLVHFCPIPRGKTLA